MAVTDLLQASALGTHKGHTVAVVHIGGHGGHPVTGLGVESVAGHQLRTSEWLVDVQATEGVINRYRLQAEKKKTQKKQRL